VGLLLGVAAFVLVADIVTKAIVVARMPDHAPIRLLGGLLTITLTRNGGAAFSIGTSMTIVFTAIAVGVVVYILRTARNLRSIGWAITLGLLLGGATGNLLDRIFRAPGPFQGHVVDWIQLPDWPVFNLADSAIVCAGVLVVLLALRGIRLDGTRPIPEASSPQPDPSETHPSEPHSSRPDPSRPDPSRPDPSEPHSSEPHSSRPGPSRLDPSEPHSSRPHSSRPDPSRPDPSEPHLSEPHPSEPHPSEPHPPDPDYPKPEYPEPQSAVPSPADSADRLADEGR
jgi:signal peptidase II